MKDNKNWRDELLNIMVPIYGIKEAERVSSVIVPAFLGDFKSELKKAGNNKIISEEYRTEDGKLTVELSGERIMGREGFLDVLRSVKAQGTALELTDTINSKNGEII